MVGALNLETLSHSFAICPVRLSGVRSKTDACRTPSQWICPGDPVSGDNGARDDYYQCSPKPKL